MEEGLRIWKLCREAAESIFGRVSPTPEYARRVAWLLFGTAAQESGLRWERQRTPRWEGNVGGFSKWQVETGSIQDSLAYLRRRPDVCARATEWLFADPKAPQTWIDLIPMEAILWALRMDDNDKPGVLFARLHYLRVSEPVPLTLYDQASYWKDHFNTIKGAGTVEQYLGSWNRWCAPVVGLGAE